MHPIPSSETFAVDLAHFIATRHEPMQWLVPGLVPEASLILLAGTPKAGKTMLAMDLVAAVSTGTPFLGRPCPRGAALYVLEEGHPAAVSERFDRALRARGGDGSGSQIALRRGLKVDVDASWEELVRTVEAHRPRLTVLDPFVKLHSAEENSAKEVAPIMSRILELTELGTSVVLVHHVGKRDEGFSSSSGAARGSSAIISSTDGNLILTKRSSADKSVRTLRLTTEMRDDEDETLNIAWWPAEGRFEVSAEVPAAAATYSGGMTGAMLAEIAAGEVQAGERGLKVNRLAAIRGVSNETARKALAAAARDGYLHGAKRASALLYTAAEHGPVDRS